MRYFWDVAAELDPAARDLAEGLRFPLCRPEPLADAGSRDAGLDEVDDARPSTSPPRFRDFDDYWTPFLGGQAPAPALLHVAQPRSAGPPYGSGSAAALPIRPDGSVALIARAWAVKGRAA